MDPRRRASALAVFCAVLGLLGGCVGLPEAGISATPTSPPAIPDPPVLPEPSRVPDPPPSPLPTNPIAEKHPLPVGVLSALPGPGSALAWTVDDGADTSVIAAYLDFVERTGSRITFFVNGQYSGWTELADRIRPLVASGQVQIGNHTWSHAALTKISDRRIIEELTRNDDFIFRTFGVSAKPYYRPPYGYRSPHTDAVAASIGYTVPVLWLGSLSDSAVLEPARVVAEAKTWFLPQHIVIGHANHPAVTKVFDELGTIIAERGLHLVTLRDYFRDP